MVPSRSKLKLIIIVNAISIMRLFLALMLVVLGSVQAALHKQWHQSKDVFYNIKDPSLVINILIFILGGIAGVSDTFDGYLARKWHAGSWFGCTFDYVADRSFACCNFITLTAIGCLPKWAPAVWVIREISSTFFFGISALPFKGRTRLARPIELFFFALVFWVNGQNRFIGVSELTKQLMWIPFYALLVFSVLKFAYYSYVQWPLCKGSLQRPSTTKFLFP